MPNRSDQNESPVKPASLGSWAIGIFVAALGLRLLYLWQIHPAPFFSLLMGDARVYDAWGRKIAAGDWLGEGVFYQAPLYPYFLGLLYKIFDGSSLVARFCQMVIGAGSCVLLGQAACRFFSKPAGIVTGFLLALYAPAIFFDGLIQKSVLDLFFVCLVLWLWGEISVLPRRHLWFGLGLGLGGLMLTRENAAVFVVAVFIWLVAHYPTLGRELFILGSLLLLGLSVVLLPVAGRNQWVGGEFHLTTSQFGPNFYIGNNPQADGTYQPLRPARGDARFERQDATELAQAAVGRNLTPGEVSRYWTREALHYMASQPWDWLRLMGRKLILACHAVEIGDAEDQSTYADQSKLLRALGYGFQWGLIFPFGLLGLWMTRSRWRRLWILYLMLGMYFASMILFCIFSRYRLPLVPFLVLFAAAGVVEMWTGWKRNPPRSWVCLIATGLIAALCHWPVLSQSALRATMLVNMGDAALSQNKLDDASLYCQAALRMNPRLAEACNILGVAHTKLGQLSQAAGFYRQALQILPSYADARLNWCDDLVAQGQLDEAVKNYREALRYEPNHPEIHYHLALALAQQDKMEEAVIHSRKALAKTPNFPEAHHQLGMQLLRQGKTAEAMIHWEEALRLQPDFPAAQDQLAWANYKLGNALFREKKTAEAVAHWRKAVQLQPNGCEAMNNLAWVLATHPHPSFRNGAEAVQLARRALALASQPNASLLGTLAAAYAEAGQFTEAVQFAEKAIAQAQASNSRDLADAQLRLELYQKHQAFRDASLR